MTNPNDSASGLTKREYFAAMTIHAIIGRMESSELGRGKPEEMRAMASKEAVLISDALIAELNKAK